MLAMRAGHADTLVKMGVVAVRLEFVLAAERGVAGWTFPELVVLLIDLIFTHQRIRGFANQGGGDEIDILLTGLVDQFTTAISTIGDQGHGFGLQTFFFDHAPAKATSLCVFCA